MDIYRENPEGKESPRKERTEFERKDSYRSSERGERGGFGKREFDRRNTRERSSYSRSGDRRNNSGYERPGRNYHSSYRRDDHRDGGPQHYRSRDGEHSGRNNYSENRDNSRNNYRNNDEGRSRSYNSDHADRRTYSRDRQDSRSYNRDSRERRPYHRDNDERQPYRRESSERRSYQYDRKSEGRRPRNDNGSSYNSDNRRSPYRREGESSYGNRQDGRTSYQGRSNDFRKRRPRISDSRTPQPPPAPEKDWVRLNKFLADAGVCSRREADKLIEAGVVKINGEVVTILGTRVLKGDRVQYEGQTLQRERHQYILLNKPKGFITTMDDPQGRKTVMSLIDGAVRERVYPVGRLDRNTSGLLLFTNDGELAKKLTHPRFNVKKVYNVELDKALTSADMRQVLEGFELEDGFIKADDIAFSAHVDSKRNVGIELHSGRNRIVRRIFEHLGYEVVKLDRVVFGPLTKKDLPRGSYRKLRHDELNILKHFVK